MQINILKSSYYLKLTSALLLLVCIFSAPIVKAQVLEYQEFSGDDTYYYYYNIVKTASGHRVDIARTHNGDTTDKQVLITDSEFKTLSWRYIRFGEETDVFAKLTREGVSIKGILDGDELDEFEELDEDEPWIQIFPMSPGFENFVLSDEEELEFWSIGTESPADMEISCFDAEKEEHGYSEDFGCDIIRVNFGPSGWKSMFWDGDYYFRPADARILGYRGDGAPGKPSSKTTLIKEE